MYNDDRRRSQNRIGGADTDRGVCAQVTNAQWVMNGKREETKGMEALEQQAANKRTMIGLLLCMLIASVLFVKEKLKSIYLR